MTTEPTKPKPKRCWLQFSLRTFFVLLTVFCVWLGWTVHQANEQRKAVAWVREMGGSVSYDYEFDEDGNIIDDAKPPGPEWLMELVGVDCFQKVSDVRICGRKVSDLTPLEKLTSLQKLDLSKTQVDDLTPLAKLPSLKWLAVDFTPVSDLTPLGGLKNLEWLCLNQSQVDDLTPLAKLTSLEALGLHTTQVSDLTPLAGLKNLEQLGLHGTPVNDLTPLAKLTSLEWLHLIATRVSEGQIKTLQQAIPSCVIVWSP